MSGLFPQGLHNLTGITVQVEEPGFELKCANTGTIHTLDDNNAIKRGSKMYVTQRMYDALKADPRIKDIKGH